MDPCKVSGLVVIFPLFPQPITLATLAIAAEPKEAGLAAVAATHGTGASVAHFMTSQAMKAKNASTAMVSIQFTISFILSEG